MSDICQRGETDIAHSGALHEWIVEPGADAVYPVPPQQLEWAEHLVFTMCEAHAATMTSLPTLPTENGQCQCRLCQV